MDIPALKRMSSSEIAAEAKRLATCEQQATAALVACLAEVDARQLFLSEGYSSMFEYCTKALHLSEGGAYNRIEVARISQRFPVVLDRLANGEVTLTVVRLLGGELTDENCVALLDEVRYESKRKVEEILAARTPRPDVRASVRKVPSGRRQTSSAGRNSVADERLSLWSPESSCATAQNDREGSHVSLDEPSHAPWSVAPLSTDRYKVQFTVSAETRAKLQRAQDLLRHAVPDADIAEVVDRALTVLIEKMERQKFASTNHPRESENVAQKSEKRDRRLPAALRRAVWNRDGGQCTYVGSNGRRCTATTLLEFHHVVPFAIGGESTVENIRLLCAGHNRLEGVQTYGKSKGSAAKSDLRAQHSTNSSRGTS